MVKRLNTGVRRMRIGVPKEIKDNEFRVGLVSGDRDPAG